MASDKRLDQVNLVNSAESVLVVNGDQVEKATLAGFANSMGSSVPLQQTSEQVDITGLYARTSDGKMVELTKESVASVMKEIIKPFTDIQGVGNITDMNDMPEGIRYIYASPYQEIANRPEDSYGHLLTYMDPEGRSTQIYYAAERRIYMRSNLGGWNPWQRIDNFGYNTLAELSSGVAGQIGVKSLSGVITVNPGEKVKILPSYAFGLIVLNNTGTGKTSIIASDSQFILEEGILFNGIGVSVDLTAPSKLCVNREKTNGEVYLKNNTSSACNIIARCVTA